MNYFNKAKMDLSKKQINFEEAYRLSLEILKKIPPLKHREERKMARKILNLILKSVLFLILIFIGLAAWFGYKINAAYVEVKEGKYNLEYCLYSIDKRNFLQAEVLSEKAQNNFSYAYSLVADLSEYSFIHHLRLVDESLYNLENLLQSGQILARAANVASRLGGNLFSLLPDNKHSFEDLSREKKKDFLKSIYENIPELNGLNANIKLALLNLDAIENFGLLLPAKKQIEELREKIRNGSKTLDDFIPLLEILPGLAGYPQTANYLLMLENQDELRPTGGFLGTYGILQIDSGEIVRLDTHDIYHLDMPVKDSISISPPAPLKKYLGVDRWYLRDANWSPDWIESAEKILWFYQEENKLLPQPDIIDDFDGVVAFTPKLITDLLEITGPIIIENEEYNSANFTQLLEYRVEKGYVRLGVSSWHRKEVIGEIMQRMKSVLLGEKSQEWQKIINVIRENLLKRDVLLSLRDKNLARLAAINNFSGEIAKTDSDYLMVVDANMGALKTDTVINRSINYSLGQDTNGLFSQLHLNYEHNGLKYDWRTADYKSYTRVYLPPGTTILKSVGFQEGTVSITEENGKTVVGGLLVVDLGKIKSIYLEYKLPEKILKNLLAQKKYSLILQKQPGKNYTLSNVNVKFLDNISFFSPVGLFTNLVANDNLNWEGEIMTDLKITIEF
jgi:hypothetical protein